MDKLDKFHTIIDSMEIKLELNNIKDLSKINIENYPYIKKDVRINSEQTEIVIPLSLNRRQGHYNMLTTLTQNEEEFEAMLNDFEVLIKDNVKLNRIDIALDSSLDFDENFKYFLYMFELCTYGNKKADKWYTTNLDTLKNNSIKQIGRKLQIAFYDKADESNGRHLYNSRMEFRFLDISCKDFKFHLEKLINLINSIDQNVELLDKNMGERIISLYNDAIKKHEVKTFSEFVRRYNKYIYTSNILKTLYEYVGLNGSYNNWVREFRRSNKCELKFFTANDVKKYKADCIRSIKSYRNN
jgi:hypothetical protein